MKVAFPFAVLTSPTTAEDVRSLARMQDPLPRVDSEWPTRSKTILLVEDDADIRLAMTYVLQTLSYNVIACADAEAASKAFRESTRVDLLMTDLQMPGRTGLELAFELTRLERTLPVLIVSASFLPSYTLNEIWRKGWAFLSKPCKSSALRKVIESLLNPSRPLAA